MLRAKGVAALGVVLGIAGFGVAEAVVEERALNVQGVTRVEVRSFNGSIRLAAGNAAPGVRITREGNVDIVVEKRGNLLYLEGKKRSLVCSRCGVSFELSLPVGLQAKLVTSNGAITVGGGVRGLEANTSNGAIQVRATGAASLSLGTSNGRIEVSEASGNVRASSSNGRIDLVNVRGQVEVSTSNSSIRLEGLTLPPGSRNSARTSNGSIEVIGPAPATPVGMVIRGNTSNGHVNFSLPGFEVQTGRTSFIARQAGEQPTELTLQTANGSITVR